MIRERSAERLELYKIFAQAAECAVLESSKRTLCELVPAVRLSEAKKTLSLTEEASRLLFELGSGRIEYFPPQGDVLERAQKGATLSCTELVQAAMLLRSARICYRAVQAVSDGSAGGAPIPIWCRASVSTAAAARAAQTQRARRGLCFLPAAGSSGVPVSSATLTPNSRLSASRFSMSGTAALVSHLLTACRLTPSRAPSSS